jgi:type IV pilus assembly protein PilM
MTAEKKHAMSLPPLACEITTHGVGAVRLHGRTGEPGAVGHYPLANGVVTPSLTSQNVQDSGALCKAIEQAVSAVGGRGETLIAVLPDAAVRVTLLDFDALPERRQEAAAAVRFRLRKSLPFDVEKAALSFDAQQTTRGLRVAAAIVLRSVLDEYESAFRAAGCSPGVVLPSSLAALGAVADFRPTMMVKVGEEATAVAVASSGHLLLYRLLEGTGSDGGAVHRLAEEIYPSLVYFQDTYGLSVEQILVCGGERLREMCAMLEEQTGVPVGALIGPGVAADGAADEFAGAIGALL